MAKLKAPFPYFGGKSKVSHIVWDALGDVRHYIEPFFGSGAVLLQRPHFNPSKHIETVNDKDGFIANVWRSIQFSPKETAKWCDWPINHADLNARRKELLKNEDRLLENLINDPMWHDPVLAGYWIWAASCWIGRGLTSKGRARAGGGGPAGVHKKSLRDKGQRPQLTSRAGVHAGQIPCVTGMNRDKVATNLYDWFEELSTRMRFVQVVCGDYSRVLGGKWQDYRGTCGIFFDPPYGAKANRDEKLYHHECLEAADKVAKWAVARGEKETYRIVLAGYYEEHEWLLEHGWTFERWVAGGGLGNRQKKNENRHKETLFFSPHCLRKKTLFTQEEDDGRETARYLRGD
jgi:DNA adenine methylase